MSLQVKEGIYFNHNAKEVISLPAGAEAPGDGWVHVSEQQECSLLGVRELLVAHGVVRDASNVYWHMPQPEEDPLTRLEELLPRAA